MNDKEITQQFLSQFPRQIDGLVYLFLRSIAHECTVHSSVYALSKQLGIYRTTLFRILYRLDQQRMIRLVKDNLPNSNSNLIIIFLLESSQNPEMNDQNVTLPTENVTHQTENVTHQTENVTHQTGNVMPDSGHDNGNHDTDEDYLEQQKKSKKENPPAPLKEKNKRKNSHNHARVSQQTLEMRKKAFIVSIRSKPP